MRKVEKTSADAWEVRRRWGRRETPVRSRDGGSRFDDDAEDDDAGEGGSVMSERGRVDREWEGGRKEGKDGQCKSR